MTTHDPYFRATAEQIADSHNCYALNALNGDCARGIICRRCGFCLKHCCCSTWDALTRWSHEVGLEMDDAILDERLDLAWADDGGRNG